MKRQFCIVYYTPPCRGGHRQVFYTPDGRITSPVDYSKFPSYAGFPYFHWVESQDEIIIEDKRLWKSLNRYWEKQKALLKLRFDYYNPA